MLAGFLEMCLWGCTTLCLILVISNWVLLKLLSDPPVWLFICCDHIYKQFIGIAVCG